MKKKKNKVGSRGRKGGGKSLKRRKRPAGGMEVKEVCSPGCVFSFT